MDKKYLNTCKEICRSNGFTVRGSAFFRVHGDGILQIIKPEKIRHWSAYSIDFGMFSMYSEMMPAWFTCTGCIPRYTTASLMGKQSPVCLDGIRENTCRIRIISFEEQLTVLEQQVLPFLNKMHTQADLIEGIRKFDSRWNDSLKFAPYLKSGDYVSAAKVIQAILDQHHDTRKSKRMHMEPDSFPKSCERLQLEDAILQEKLAMAQRGNSVEIEEYLLQNYTRNSEHALFAMRRKSGQGAEIRLDKTN